MTGLVTSFTITLNEHVDTFPASSVAVYVTRVVPIGNVSPGLWSLVNVALQLSDTVGTAQFTTALHEAVALTILSDGQLLMTGLVTSFTITLNEHVEMFPAPSLAVYVTVVVPTA